MDKLKVSIKKICKLPNKHEVEYVIVGGFAVIFHGFPRSTADIDFYYNPIVSNFHKLVGVFEELGIDVSDLKSLVFDPQKSFLRIS